VDGPFRRGINIQCYALFIINNKNSSVNQYKILNFKIEGTRKKSGEHKIVQTILPNSEQKKTNLKMEQKT
jgi:hypothetical protein